MHVVELETEDISVNEPRIVDEPTEDEVSTAISEMSGAKQSSLVLQGHGDSYMGVVSTDDDGFIVAGFLEDTGSYIFASGAGDGTNTVEVLVGGQECQYADYEIATRAQALQSALTFLREGRCDPQFRWNPRAARMSKSH